MNLKLKIFLLTTFIAIAAGIGFSYSLAQEATPKEQAGLIDTSGLGLIAVGAGLGIGVAGLGAGIGLGIATSAIAAAGAERPEIIMRFFIFIVFIEAIAIYALIVAIFVITILPGAM